MVPPIAHVVLPDNQSNLSLALAVARLSSSPSAREAARAWVAAHQAAPASSVLQNEPVGEAAASCHCDVDGPSPRVAACLEETSA